MTVRTRPTRRLAGATVCPVCRDLVENLTLVEVIKPGKTKGKVMCTPCAIREAERS